MPRFLISTLVGLPFLLTLGGCPSVEGAGLGCFSDNDCPPECACDADLLDFNGLCESSTDLCDGLCDGTCDNETTCPTGTSCKFAGEANNVCLYACLPDSGTGGSGGTGGAGGTGGSGGGGPDCVCPGLDCVEFLDGQFADSEWASEAVQRSGTWDYSAEQRSDDGNPAPYRFVRHTGGEESGIWVAHEKLGPSYDPGSEGPIASIYYSLDGKALEGSRQASLKALAKQGDRWFWSTNLVLINEGPDGWVTKNWGDEDLASPPFSSGELNLVNGGPITFGFYTGASHTGGVPEVTRNTGVDNWRVVICKE